MTVIFVFIMIYPFLFFVVSSCHALVSIPAVGIYNAPSRGGGGYSCRMYFSKKDFNGMDPSPRKHSCHATVQKKNRVFSPFIFFIYLGLMYVVTLFIFRALYSLSNLIF